MDNERALRIWNEVSTMLADHGPEEIALEYACRLHAEWEKECAANIVQVLPLKPQPETVTTTTAVQGAITGKLSVTAPPSQPEPVAWRIKTSVGTIIYEDSDPRNLYSQGWLDKCQEVLPLYLAHPAAPSQDTPDAKRYREQFQEETRARSRQIAAVRAAVDAAMIPNSRHRQKIYDAMEAAYNDAAMKVKK